MMTQIAQLPNKVMFAPVARLVHIAWTNQSPPPHEFLAAICPDEEDDGFCAFAVNYPGVISQGDTVEEAKANIGEAFLAMLASRRKHGEAMPFSSQPVDDFPKECTRAWISVNG